jgi:hypothetical protein
MAFDQNRALPKDRSIFRKHIGRALLHRDADAYASLWDIDFTERDARDKYRSRRDVEKEREVEREVTRILRERFTFRWIELEGEDQRLGSQGLEAALIGTFACCGECRPSAMWLGRFSPQRKIAQADLWQLQHLRAPGLTEESIAEIANLFSGRCCT